MMDIGEVFCVGVMTVATLSLCWTRDDNAPILTLIDQLVASILCAITLMSHVILAGNNGRYLRGMYNHMHPWLPWNLPTTVLDYIDEIMNTQRVHRDEVICPTCNPNNLKRSVLVVDDDACFEIHYS